MHFATCIYQTKGHTSYIQGVVLDTKMGSNGQFIIEVKSLGSKTRMPGFKPQWCKPECLILILKKSIQ